MIQILPRLLLQPRERPPNEQAKQITGRPYLSYSQLSLMRACPRKFSFQYVGQVTPDFLSSSLLFGASIHAAFELHFRALLEGLTATPEALLSAYHDAWRHCLAASPNTPVRFNKGEDIHKLSTLAHLTINAFLRSELAVPNGKILGVEEELRVVLHPDLPDLLARVDLVYWSDDALHVVDFKTSRSKWSQEKVQESLDQLLLYAQATSEMSQSLSLPVKLHFAVVTKAKKPVVQVLDAPVHPSRLEAVQEGVAQVWDAIKAGHFYPNPSQMNCSLCQFQSRCPVFKKS